MARIEFYRSFLDLKSVQEIDKSFTDSLLTTNRSYDFFVNWEKVKRNIKKFKIEIGILGTLTTSKNFEKDLKKILLEYPKTALVLPLLIAVRNQQFDVIDGVSIDKVHSFDFSKEPSIKDIDKLIIFTKKTGIRDLFAIIQVLNDYLLGVEVGLDTNARKNRSGSFMEDVMTEQFIEIQKDIKKIEIFPKGKFKDLASKHDVKIPKELRDRTPDFVLRKGKKLLTAEVNFYSGQGSKPQEIVDSYINRQRELKAAGWEFIWITDGDAWRGGQNQIEKAISQMDFVLNIHFVKKGFLKYILQNY